MNRDRVKGTIDEMVGSAKRKAGQLTGDTPLQVKGIAQQVKGKLENTLGKTKDAVRGANQGTKSRNGARA
ncbi:MAG: CsbD family protein [Terracidiphilus sp.]